MRLTPAVRISLCLVCLTVSLLLLGKSIGFAPDWAKTVFESRRIFSETMAVQFSAAAERGDLPLIRQMLQTMIERDKDIRSAAVRSRTGDLLAKAGNHLASWQPPPDGRSTPTHVQIPIFRGTKRWATVEISFAPLWIANTLASFKNSYLGLILFVSLAGFGGYFLFIKRTLRELDPSNVIPGRVQAAFNVLKEGVLILDEEEQIVLANTSFAETVGRTPEKLIGYKGSELDWKGFESMQNRKMLPWMDVLQEGSSRVGIRLIMERADGTPVKFIVNAAPVLDDKGNRRGVLVTFDDVTELEEKNQELNQTVNKLQMVTDEVQTKNRELEFLATHDPLTLLLNRRALNRRFERVFNEERQHGRELSCIMCDIDHFKSVNDRYGHPAGDQVIKLVAGILQKNSRESDLVGRYGGEEFCAVLPGLDIKQATKIANRIRLAVKEDSASGVQVTMSFGVSSLRSNVHEPGELINQADKALYIAKESGRNRVVCWDDEEMADYVAQQGKKKAKTEDGGSRDFPAVPSAGQQEQQEYKEEVHRLTVRLQAAEELAEKRRQELKYFNVYDKLTGLPTRTLFRDRISQALARGKRYNNIVAVLTLVVDAVHRVNETLGHDAGDQLFKKIAGRLTKTIRTRDTVAKLPFTEPPTVFRVGQDEFSILLIDLEEVNVITWIVRRILSAFEPAFQVNGNDIHVIANIGISIFPYDGHTPEVLQKNAAAAQSHAGKQLGANRYCFYSDSIHAESIKHLQIENQLHKAVRNNEFILHYQPKIHAGTQKIVGMEALIRWENPETGLMSPYEFIHVAELSGLIGKIGEWVLATACRQVRSWLDLGLEDCSIAVNFSNRQFYEKDLADRIKKILHENSLEPAYLVVEVTESAMMEDINSSMNILHKIKEMGASIALDDFGTGYSSLEYLKNCPVSHVKIDRTFIADIETNERDATLVKSIISMAHGMNLKVTAEGVEKEEQAELLESFGCDELQGHLFSKPVSADKATELLRTGIASRFAWSIEQRK